MERRRAERCSLLLSPIGSHNTLPKWPIVTHEWMTFSRKVGSLNSAQKKGRRRRSPPDRSPFVKGTPTHKASPFLHSHRMGASIYNILIFFLFRPPPPFRPCAFSCNLHLLASLYFVRISSPPSPPLWRGRHKLKLLVPLSMVDLFRFK